ncbi:MAG TPA: alpha/beta fold hydrolase [Acidimicrobiales bacterium]|nr:alpha/beta fold hydrolase [Acidimicrobiales bacterium]
MSRSRVVLVHGFTQTAASWPPAIVGSLEQAGHDVVAVDAPGHGSAADVRADLVQGAAMLAEHGPAHFVGYSMGGRLALHVAVNHPTAVEKLVLVGATAGIDDPGERAARRAADDDLAASIERDGVDAFLERWLANPLFATLPAEANAMESRRANTAAGLAASLRLMGTGTQEPLWDALPRVTNDVLFLVGEVDQKFTALAHRMARAWGGRASVDVIEGAGHAVHLERPDEVARRIVAFLDGAHDASNAPSTTP